MKQCVLFKKGKYSFVPIKGVSLYVVCTREASLFIRVSMCWPVMLEWKRHLLFHSSIGLQRSIYFFFPRVLYSTTILPDYTVVLSWSARLVLRIFDATTTTTSETRKEETYLWKTRSSFGFFVYSYSATQKQKRKKNQTHHTQDDIFSRVLREWGKYEGMFFSCILGRLDYKDGIISLSNDFDEFT